MSSADICCPSLSLSKFVPNQLNEPTAAALFAPDKFGVCLPFCVVIAPILVEILDK